jgi:dephospho-CoA kinase
MDYKYSKNMLIGIKGKMGAGKTTSSSILKKNYQCIEYAMAQPIKEIAKILGFTETELYGTQCQKLKPNAYWGVSAREFLQKFGTDICRDYLPTKIPQMNNPWIRCFEIFCKQNHSENIIVSDIRFLDEANAIKKCGGIIIEIYKTPKGKNACENVSDFETGEFHDPEFHASETEMDQIKVDYIIKNDQSLEFLQEELLRVVIKHYLI